MYKNPLGFEKLSKLLRSFAIPSIISMLVSSLYNIVDQIFIGQGVGYLGNAATNVAFPLTTISVAIALLVGIGSASRFSLYIGAKENDKAACVVGNGFVSMLILSALYVSMVLTFLTPLLYAFGSTDQIFPYAYSYTQITTWGVPFLITTNVMSNMIRADGSPKYSMACMVLGAVINTILDPIFIFVFDMGVEGAAWATVIGQIASALMALRYLKLFKNVNLVRSDFRFSFHEFLSTSAIGISSCVNQISLMLVQIILNNSMTYYGQFSIYGQEIPLAACGIVMKTNAILLAIIIGISQGMQPIVGFNYGAKQYDRVRGIFMLALKLNLVVSVIGWSLFQFCPGMVLSIFGSGDKLYFEFAIRFMRTYLFMAAINGVQMLSSGFFSAIGKPLKGMVLSLTRQVLFFIPLALIFPIFMGLDGLIYAAPVADFVAFIVSVCLLRHEWKNLHQLEKNQKAAID